MRNVVKFSQKLLMGEGTGKHRITLLRREALLFLTKRSGTIREGHDLIPLFIPGAYVRGEITAKSF